MSIDTTRVHCTGCDFEFLESYPPVYLKCAFGTGVVTYYQTRAWCRTCNTIRGVESLPTPEEIRENYAEWYGVPGPPVRGLKILFQRFDKKNAAYREELELKLAWRAARTAPPHCLTCGSTELAELDFVELSESSVITRTFRHHCGGFLVHDFEDKTGIRIHFSPKEIWMDIEGNKLSV